jgi:hypothetical protein
MYSERLSGKILIIFFTFYFLHFTLLIILFTFKFLIFTFNNHGILRHTTTSTSYSQHSPCP